jgi:hypothetical protein
VGGCLFWQAGRTVPSGQQYRPASFGCFPAFPASALLAERATLCALLAVRRVREGVTSSDVADRRLVPVGSSEVLSLLATVRVGRVAFSYRALPAVQLVSHVIDGGDIVFRSHGRPPVIAPAHSGNVVLAYEADVIDPRTFAGWRVTVTGSAGLVRDPGEAAHYRSVLPSWPAGNGAGQFIRLHPGLMSGYRFLGPGD